MGMLTWINDRRIDLYCCLGIERVASLLPRLTKRQVMRVLLRFGADIDEDCDIEIGLSVYNTKDGFRNLHLGNRCHIGRNVFLDLKAPIVMEDQVTISMGVTLLTHIDVDRSNLKGLYPIQSDPIRICRNAYIGANATVLQGVIVGEESIVASGSLVNKNVPSHVVVAGVPARIVKQIGR
jgi:acetyltransferase-like isoleucine patch superfamily enzyme